MISYKEIIISDDSYKNKRGEAERVAFNNWISKELDIVFKNNIVPFHKPICEIVQGQKIVKWNGFMSHLYKSQENYRLFIDLMPDKCPQCGVEIENEREYNYTRIAGCKLYDYNKCSFGQTFYRETTFFRLGLLESSLSLFELDKLLERIEKYGANGMPDFVGLKNNVLYLIEVKDIKEKIFNKQHDWLNWFSLNTNAQGILIRLRP